MDWRLGANQENLTIVGTATKATGNNLDNIIRVGIGSNRSDSSVDGGGGNDTLYGGKGTDFLAGSTISVDQFRIGTGAGDASDRFIYNQNTGALFFDADGIGGAAQVKIATLSAGLAMTNDSIHVF